jgi:hypothetical protein
MASNDPLAVIQKFQQLRVAQLGKQLEALLRRVTPAVHPELLFTIADRSLR